MSERPCSNAKPHTAHEWFGSTYPAHVAGAQAKFSATLFECAGVEESDE